MRISSFVLFLAVLFFFGCDKGSGSRHTSAGNPGSGNTPDPDDETGVVLRSDPLPFLEGTIYLGNYNSHDGLYSLDVYDPESGEIAPFVEFEVEGVSQPYGLGNFSFSPDGRFFSYVPSFYDRSLPDNRQRTDTYIIVVDLIDGVDVINIPINRSTNGWYELLWTEDSRFLIFSVYGQTIFSLEISSGSLSVLVATNTPFRTYDHMASVSPSGEYLVLGHHEFGSLIDLYVSSRNPETGTISATRLLRHMETQAHDENLGVQFFNETEFVFRWTKDAGPFAPRSPLYTISRGDAEAGEVFDLFDVRAEGTFHLTLSPRKDLILYRSGDAIFSAEVGIWQPQERVRFSEELCGHVRITPWSPQGGYFIAEHLQLRGCDRPLGESEELFLFEVDDFTAWPLSLDPALYDHLVWR